MTGYLYDGDCVVAEFDARGKVRAQYIHGPGLGADVGSLICAQKLGDDGAMSERYYSHNWRGDTIGITDESGASLARYRYGAFGDLIAGDGGIANNILFSGKRYDSAVGLYYFGARYYDASSGRFVSRDPMGYIDGPNEYIFVKNNPLYWIDPTGLQSASFMMIEPPLPTIETNPPIRERDLVIDGEPPPKIYFGPLINPIQERNPKDLIIDGEPPPKIDFGPFVTPPAPEKFRTLIYTNKAGAEQGKYVLDEEGRKHILGGDGPERGGGHRFGTNKPGKTEFPEKWCDEKILDVVHTIANDKESKINDERKRGNYIALESEKHDIPIRVVVDTSKSRIVTAYPVKEVKGRCQ